MDADWKNKRALVTGGLGFIGSNLAIDLVARGASVTIVDSLIPSHGGDLRNIATIRGRADVHLVDLREARALPDLVADQDFVFHLAGQVSHGDSMRDPELDLSVNCVATINLLESCRHHNPTAVLVFSSTRQVYGAPTRLPVTEDHPTVPVDVNGINKLTAEYYHLLYHRTYDLQSVVLRLTNTYGPRQQIKNDRQGFTGVFLRKALRGERISVYGDGEQRRDFNHVDDVVSALVLAATTRACRGKIWNLGASDHHSLNQFVQLLAEFATFEVEKVPFPHDRRLIDIGHCYSDWSRFAAATGWRPRIDLREGLSRSIDFFRQHADVYLR